MQVVASIRRKADQRSKLLGRCHSSLYTEGGRRDYADADTGAEASASSYSAVAAAMEATALEVLPKKANAGHRGRGAARHGFSARDALGRRRSRRRAELGRGEA